MDCQSIGIIGAGTMGTQIAALAASCGHSVKVYDICLPASIEKQISRTQRFLRRNPGIKQHLAADAEPCHFVNDVRDLADVSVIIECVAEDMATKCEVLKAISSLVSKDAILGTNTSSLDLGELAKSVTDNSRFLGIHFFNPIYAVPLVELCALPDTRHACTSKMRGLLRSFGRIVVTVPNSPGFVVNRLLFLMIASAARMVDEGGISPSAIDTAMKTGTNMPMGPLELADLIGLDICANILQSLHRQTGDAAYATPLCIRDCVNDGHYGRKTGVGLYKGEVHV